MKNSGKLLYCAALEAVDREDGNKFVVHVNAQRRTRESAAKSREKVFPIGREGAIPTEKLKKQKNRKNEWGRHIRPQQEDGGEGTCSLRLSRGGQRGENRI